MSGEEGAGASAAIEADVERDDLAGADGPLDLDWSSGRDRPLGLRAGLALAGLVVLWLAFVYHYLLLEPDAELLGYEVGRLDWLWLACLWVNVAYVGVPAVRNPGRTLAFARRLARRPAALVASGFVAVVFLAGTLGPVVLGQPEPDFVARNQPPVYASITTDSVVQCLGAVVDERCHGSWQYPLGTDNAGKDMIAMLVVGARVVVQLAVVPVTMIVPLATLAGTVAAYAGGLTDRAVTTVAETLKAVPALLVFLVWRWVAEDGSLFAFVVIFGLINWGNVAVVVRSRALDEVSKEYVRAAEAAGAGRLSVVREHLVPNVSRTAASAAVYQVPLFVTIEATLSFLKFGAPPSPLLLTPPTVISWGRMIGRNVAAFKPYWWPVVGPVLALLLTILALNVVANHLQDVLDPRASEG